MSREFLNRVLSENFRDALDRSLDAYLALVGEGYSENVAALLVVAAQIDWLAVAVTENIPGNQ